MQGKIVKGIAGFYYVHVSMFEVYECRAKGIFRNQNIKPLVGDIVDIEVLDEAGKKGSIIEILPRKNQLIRPLVANVDQALVIFAAKGPDPNFNLLDRFLVMMLRHDVETVICFNKTDKVTELEITKLQNIYEKCGYKVMFISAKMSEGMEDILTVLKGKTTVLAGPSGVGKSTLINLITPEANMETGDISEKLKRGKHTTRHSELFSVDDNTYIMDTPGFSSLYVNDFEKEDLKDYFLEFQPYKDQCRFLGCNHINEPGCEVKAALDKGEINRIRYENYVFLFNELKEQRRY